MIIDVTMIYHDSKGMQHLLNNFRAMVENYSDCINYDSIKPFIQDKSLHGIIINNDTNRIVQYCGYSFEHGLYTIVLQEV